MFSSGGESGGAIKVVVAGFVVFVVAVAVVPILWANFDQLNHLTNDHCMAGGQRFTYVNTTQDWSGTAIQMGASVANAANGLDKKCMSLGTAYNGTDNPAMVYLPNGQSVAATVVKPADGTKSNTAADNTAIQLSDGHWEKATSIIQANGQINGLIITILPIAVAAGGLAVAGLWIMNRGRGMMSA